MIFRQYFTHGKSQDAQATTVKLYSFVWLCEKDAFLESLTFLFSNQGKHLAQTVHLIEECIYV